MKVEIAWKDNYESKDPSVKYPVYDMCYSPDGSQLIVAVDRFVRMYNGDDGKLIQSLKGHKENVYCVAYAADGKRFASGGADFFVIVWSNKGEGILKYTHATPVVQLSYGPGTNMLASVTSEDFGLWSVENKSVVKFKLFSKVLCCSWSSDGQHLALGLYNGQVSIRDKDGTEKITIERRSPVWALEWSPSREDILDVLAVGCWDQSLSFYHLSGVQQHKERKLGFDPMRIKFVPNGNFLLIGGKDMKANLCTKEGVFLCTICDKEPEWVWSVAAHPIHNRVAVGCNGGTLTTYKLDYKPIQSMYQDRYAYRENMTDVIVQHVMTEQKVRIKCRDYVKGVGLYRNRLAVQLADRLHIYELNHHESEPDMHYRVKEKIYKTFNQDQLLVTSDHIVISLEARIQLFNFKGVQEREWVFDSAVTCVKLTGGPPGKEGLIVGCENGHVMRIFVNNTFPVTLYEAKHSVKQVDLSSDRKILGIVDRTGQLVIYDIFKKIVLFEEVGASQVCFNSEVDEMFCYVTSKEVLDGDVKAHTSTHIDSILMPNKYTYLSVKCNATSEEQKHTILLDSCVVGFNGSRVFLGTLDKGVITNQQTIAVSGISNALTTLDLSMGSSLSKYIANKDFKQAYQIACLGVTESDWRLLANSALMSLDFDTAKKAFVRLADIKYIDFIDFITSKRKSLAGGGIKSSNERGKRSSISSSTKADDICIADIMAFSGAFQEAAKMFARINEVDMAISIFSDLRLWDEAKMFAASNAGGSAIDTKELVRRQAEWAEETNDWKSAVDMWVAAGNPGKAVKIIGNFVSKKLPQGEVRWQVKLIDICRALMKSDTSILEDAAMIFSSEDEDEYAKEIYTKIDDYSSLMTLYTKRQNWEAVVKLAEAHAGKFEKSVFLPYAEWLAFQDRFDEALSAYWKAGRPDIAQRVMEQLTTNAISENRFKDASYYYFLMAADCLKLLSSLSVDSPNYQDEISKALRLYEDMMSKADIYYAYSFVQSYSQNPFTNLQPLVLFQVARYLINSLGNSETPPGISRVNTLYTLAKQGKALGAFKLARFVYDRLQKLKLPDMWGDSIDIDIMTIQAKPVRDNNELLPVCYRCGYTNPLLNPFTSQFTRGDVCTNCGHPFVRSFNNFEILPLVEFQPEDSISDKSALDLIRTPPVQINGERTGRGGGRGNGRLNSQWREQDHGGNVQSMTFDNDADNYGDNDEGNENGGDHFNACLNRALEQQEGANTYVPIVANAKTLANLRREEVFVCRNPLGCEEMPYKYYKNMLYPDIPIALSQACRKFFHEEDFEFAYLTTEKCPFSRVKDVGDYGSV